MRASLSSGLAKAGLALYGLSLFLPWMRIFDTYNGQTSWGSYSPLGVISFYPSICANSAFTWCVANILGGFLMVQLPFLLTIFWAAMSVWRQGSRAFTAVLGFVSIGIWAFFAIGASTAEPIFEKGPYVGLYVAAVGSFLLVGAWATQHDKHDGLTGTK